MLRREAGEVVHSRPARDVAELRVDQLLTSRLFGLHSTLDPGLEAQYDRYYALLARDESAREAAERWTKEQVADAWSRIPGRPEEPA